MIIRRFSTIILLFFFCLKIVGQSQKELFFSDYSTNDAVENVYILSKSGQFLAISNKKGKAYISHAYDSIQVKRLGYKDTVFAVLNSSNRLALKIETNLLNEVVLKDRRKDPFELLQSAHDNSWDWYKESMKYAKNYSFQSKVNADSYGSRSLSIPVMTLTNFSNRNFFPLPRELACDTVILESNLDTLKWLHRLQILPSLLLYDVIGYKHLSYPFKEDAKISGLTYSKEGLLEISMSYSDTLYTLAKYKGKVLIDTTSNLILSVEAFASELDVPITKPVVGFDSIQKLGLSGSYYRITFHNDPFNYYLKQADVLFKQSFFLDASADTAGITSEAQLRRIFSEPCEDIYHNRLNMLDPLVIYKNVWTGFR